MKSLAMKFTAIVLAAVFLLTGVASVLGMVFAAILDEEQQTPDEIYYEELRHEARMVAYAQVCAWRTYQNSPVPREVVDWGVKLGVVDVSGLPLDEPLDYGLKAVGWIIAEQNGEFHTEGDMTPGAGRYSFYFEAISPSYEIVMPSTHVQEPQKHTFGYGGISYSVLRRIGVPCSVEVMVEVGDIPFAMDLLFFVYAISDMLPLILIASLLLFGMCMVYLCWVAGRKKGADGIHPAGLNALPLDLYTVAVGFLGAAGIYVWSRLGDTLENGFYSWMLVWLMAILSWVICLLPVIYIFAIAAQVKAGNFYWWRRSIVGMALRLCWKAAKWLIQGLRQVFSRAYRALRSMARMIPTVWQWLLTAFLMVFIPVILLILATTSWGSAREFFVILLLGSLVCDIALVWYGGWCFGTILKAAKRMAAGDLDAKIDTKQLYGSFRGCAEHLNTTSDAAMLAAREKIKSERMKTELITNVSHDIKTPLTSLINYVDLLQKPHTQEEGQQYLEVLARQSARLKKLIEDLMEMSKASTGNVTTQITQVNAAEAVHQALGEFADKLLAARLTSVVRLPEEPVSMQADGRLAWRVMGNLLSNAVKYAMPGTRLYVDVEKQENRVLISFKNISAEPLNISAEELMERFVRGDASRNTEGSGLGLNIAASLMEVQGGRMEVLVDGDLFKVTLFFPCS